MPKSTFISSEAHKVVLDAASTTLRNISVNQLVRPFFFSQPGSCIKLHLLSLVLFWFHLFLASSFTNHSKTGTQKNCFPIYSSLFQIFTDFFHIFSLDEKTSRNFFTKLDFSSKPFSALTVSSIEKFGFTVQDNNDLYVDLCPESQG